MHGDLVQKLSRTGPNFIYARGKAIKVVAKTRSLYISFAFSIYIIIEKGEAGSGDYTEVI